MTNEEALNLLGHILEDKSPLDLHLWADCTLDEAIDVFSVIISNMTDERPHVD